MYLYFDFLKSKNNAQIYDKQNAHFVMNIFVEFNGGNFSRDENRHNLIETNHNLAYKFAITITVVFMVFYDNTYFLRNNNMQGM